MAVSKTKQIGPPVIIETYHATYSNGVKAAKSLTAANFGITKKTGYTIGAVVRWYSGDSTEDVAQVHARTSGTVMVIKDCTQTAISNATAYIRLMWVRNDLIAEKA